MTTQNRVYDQINGISKSISMHGKKSYLLLPHPLSNTLVYVGVTVLKLTVFIEVTCTLTPGFFVLDPGWLVTISSFLLAPALERVFCAITSRLTGDFLELMAHPLE